MGLFSFLGFIIDSLFDGDSEKSEEQLEEEKEEREQEEQNKKITKELEYKLYGRLSHPKGGNLTIDEVDASVWDHSKEASAYVSVTIRIGIPVDIERDNYECDRFKDQTESDYLSYSCQSEMEDDVKYALSGVLGSYLVNKSDYKVSASVSISLEYYTEY